MDSYVRQALLGLRKGNPIRTDPEVESDFINCIESYRATCERIRENHKQSRSELACLKMDLQDAKTERDYYKNMLKVPISIRAEKIVEEHVKALSEECDTHLSDIKKRLQSKIKKLEYELKKEKKQNNERPIVYRDNPTTNDKYKYGYEECKRKLEETNILFNKCIDDCFEWELKYKNLLLLLAEAERILLLEGKQKTW